MICCCSSRFVGATLAVSLILAPGCTRRNAAFGSGDTIKIGAFLAMTGAEAAFGTSTDKGARLAIDAKNLAGGIQGRKIELLTEDDQGKSEEAVAVVRKLIGQNRVLALIGEVASSRTLAAAPIAQNLKVPMVSPSSTNPKVTQVGDYIFRVCFIDPFQGPLLAHFAYENLKLKRVAVLKDLKTDYSVGLAEFFVKKFKELGGEITSEQTFQTGDSDFKGQLTRLRTATPDAIFIPSYYGNVGMIARQVRQLGIKAVLLGGDAWDSPKLFELGEDAVQGAYFSVHYSSESPAPATREFIRLYIEKYHETPDGMAATGYDAAQVLLSAMEHSSILTSEAIRIELTKIQGFPGATGKITINSERNAEKDGVIVKVQGKAFKFVTMVSPR
jgi:branched-chain amino acid transport system substrate-binding protein